MRRSGDAHAIVVMNLTPIPHDGYRIGVPEEGEYRCVLSTDDTRWGGSGYGARATVWADDHPMHGRRYSLDLVLPPLSVMVFVPARMAPGEG
jgi:1,4-alpha-glucan branching enzyme